MMNIHEQLFWPIDRVADTNIVICGAGAFGANLTETLARMGMKKIEVIDFDTITAHNLSTQPWTYQQIGMKKVAALKANVYAATKVRITAVDQRLTAANAIKLLQLADVVVDCFDNVESRRLVELRSAAPVLHSGISMDSRYVCSFWDEAFVMPEYAPPADNCDYPQSRPMVMIGVAAASQVLLHFLLSGAKLSSEHHTRSYHV